MTPPFRRVGARRRIEPEAGVKWEVVWPGEEDKETMTEQAPCPRCRHANPPENHFCGSCGASLGSSDTLVPRREGNLTVVGHTLPSKLSPAGKALAVGLAVLATKVGLSWLRRRTKTERWSSAPSRAAGVAAMPERLFARNLEELLIQEWEEGHRSSVVAWQAIQSIIITQPTDRRRSETAIGPTGD
jgi:hypothetical protein